jgi:acetylornithine deacetylase/succinyl-diaminopimelate desuccinylase-like protein
MVSGMHDRNGMITVPGFYESVRKYPDRERVLRSRDSPSDVEMLRDAAVRRSWGDRRYTMYERTTIMPALIVTGLRGGYTGEGAKSVVPPNAYARLNVRIVPDQDPGDVARRVRAHLIHLAPKEVSVRIRCTSTARPVHVNPRHTFMRIAAGALERSFGEAPALLRSGGTIPVFGALVEVLGLPVIAMGLARPDDGAHGPDEKVHLGTLFKGVDASIRFLRAIGRRTISDHESGRTDR